MLYIYDGRIDMFVQWYGLLDILLGTCPMHSISLHIGILKEVFNPNSLIYFSKPDR